MSPSWGEIAAIIGILVTVGKVTNFRHAKKLIIWVRGSKSTVVTAAMLEDLQALADNREVERLRWQRRHSECEKEVQWCEGRIRDLQSQLRNLGSGHGSIES